MGRCHPDALTRRGVPRARALVNIRVAAARRVVRPGTLDCAGCIARSHPGIALLRIVQYTCSPTIHPPSTTPSATTTRPRSCGQRTFDRPGAVRRLHLPQTGREKAGRFVSVSSMRTSAAGNTRLTTCMCCATLHVCENQVNVKCVRQRVITLLASTNCIVRAVRRTFCHYGEGASIDRVQRRPADGRVFLCFQVC